MYTVWQSTRTTNFLLTKTSVSFFFFSASYIRIYVKWYTWPYNKTIISENLIIRTFCVWEARNLLRSRASYTVSSWPWGYRNHDFYGHAIRCKVLYIVEKRKKNCNPKNDSEQNLVEKTTKKTRFLTIFFAVICGSSQLRLKIFNFDWLEWDITMSPRSVYDWIPWRRCEVLRAHLLLERWFLIKKKKKSSEKIVVKQKYNVILRS